VWVIKKMSNFNDLDRALRTQISNIRKKIDLVHIMNEEQRFKQKPAIERDMEKLSSTFSAMDIFVRTQPDASVLLISVNRYRHEISQLEIDVGKVYPAASTKKIQETFEVKNADQRTRLLDGNEKLDKATGGLNTTHAVAIDTEEIGASTLNELARQRGIIEGGIVELDQVDSQVDRIRNVLSSMGRRLITDKFILSFIIFLLLAAIGFVVGWKWIRPLIENKKT